MQNNPEPPFDPLADTNPTITIKPEETEKSNRIRSIVFWSSLVGMIALLGIVGITLLSGNTDATMVNDTPNTIADGEIVVEPSATTDIVANDPTSSVAEAIDSTAIPPDVINTSDVSNVTVAEILPTLDTQQIQTLLQTPVALDQVVSDPAYNPFTLIPERPRNEFVNYVITQGDTIDAIAQRYNLAQESIAWCNDRRIILTIRPGDVLRIPPVDGACHPVLGTRNQTIAEIADEYGIDDPYQVLDSPYNPMLFGRSPEDILPGGTTIFLPGGEGELITWNPGSDIERNADGTVSRISFAPGQSGSCGAVEPGGGAYWANPLPAGSWVRGFYAGHTGIDLSAPVGTPIYAANSGPVLFSGFSQWGYGETVVLGHGPFSTLYGHMSSRNVSCGQFVTVGQVIGFVGSTGNSSGPHLHFEIRYDDTPQDPSLTAGIGW